MKTLALLGAVATLLPVIASAQTADTIPVREAQPARSLTVPVESYVAAYWVPINKLHDDGDTVSGDGGFGVAGLAAIGSGRMHPFVIGDYQQTKFNDFDQTEKNIRFGAGMQFLSWLGAYAEYAQIKFNNTLDGFGLHARFTPVVGPVSLMFQVGYLDLKNSNEGGSDADGADIGIGAAMHFTRTLSAIADWRITVLSPKEGGDSLTLNDFRVGGRFDFGS